MECQRDTSRLKLDRAGRPSIEVTVRGWDGNKARCNTLEKIRWGMDPEGRSFTHDENDLILCAEEPEEAGIVCGRELRRRT